MQTDNDGENGADVDEIADNSDPVADAERMADEAIAADKRAAEDAKKEAERLAQLETAAVLTPSDILGAEDLPTEWVYVPGWKGKVLVRALTGTERDFFESSIVKQRGKVREVNTENIRAKLCQLAIVDPTAKVKNSPMFTRKQIDALGKKSAADLDVVYDVASRLSGLGKNDVEELAGNSEAGSADSSSS